MLLKALEKSKDMILTVLADNGVLNSHSWLVRDLDWI